MELSNKAIQKQAQTLALTPAMRQSLKILQMSQLDLYEFVREELESNPLLEEGGGAREQIPEMLPLSISELQQDMFFPEEREHSDASEEVSPLLFAHREQTFTAMLLEQIGTYELPALTEKISRYLVDCLDDRGYLAQDPAEIAEQLRMPYFEVMQALYFLQSLTPTGVGARSLEECLTLQLAQGENFNEHTLRIVSGGLRLLAQNRISAIAEMLHTDIMEAQKACAVIRALNPIPSRGYAAQSSPGYIIPDAVVECTDHEINLRLNNSFIPKVMLSREYAGILTTLEAGEAKDYIEENVVKAEALIRGISERGRTLQRVILSIVELQPQFFREGRGLIPMTMNDIAERLEMNISTVSRAVRGKYIVCRRGTVSLRSLFTTGFVSEENRAVSSDVIKEKIHRMIAAEDTTCPLSDAALSDALGHLGFKISRRTIAKYRDEMGIASSKLRKRRV